MFLGLVSIIAIIGFGLSWLIDELRCNNGSVYQRQRVEAERAWKAV